MCGQLCIITVPIVKHHNSAEAISKCNVGIIDISQHHNAKGTSQCHFTNKVRFQCFKHHNINTTKICESQSAGAVRNTEQCKQFVESEQSASHVRL